MPASLYSAVCLLGIAVGTVYTGCRVSQVVDATADEVVDLDWSQVLLIPVMSSAMLLLLFYHFWLLQYLLLAVLVVSSFTSVSECARHLLTFYLGTSSTTTTRSVFCAFVSAVVLYGWMIQSNFVAHDIIGCSLCVTFISILRFPSLRLASLCLSLLFLYDLFWVFYSESIFQKNVMVEVATKQASNPLQQIGERMGVSALASITRHVDLPLKLILPTWDGTGGMSVLGLGDIAMPGILCSLALRCDCSPQQQPFSRDGTKEREYERDLEEESGEGVINPSDRLLSSSSASPAVIDHHFHSALLLPQAAPTGRRLFGFALSGYALGLSAAFAASSYWATPQPALIYIVPGVILPLCWRAHAEGRFQLLWVGPKIEKPGE